MAYENKAHELAQAVCNALGGDWHPNQPSDDSMYDRSADLIGADGAQLHLSLTWAGKGKIHICGSDRAVIGTANTPYGIKLPSINVSDTKTPEQIAKDIKRRLLPEYGPVLAEIKARWQSQLDFEAGVNATQDAIIGMSGGKRSTQDSGRIYGVRGPSIEVTSPDSIKVTYLYLTLNQYKRMKEALPELWQEEDES
jgi:hypothetical protein